MDRLDKLQKKYTALLELYPHGGIEAAERYRSSSVLLDQRDGEIEKLEREIPKLEKHLSNLGIIWENWLNPDEEQA